MSLPLPSWILYYQRKLAWQQCFSALLLELFGSCKLRKAGRPCAAAAANPAQSAPRRCRRYCRRPCYCLTALYCSAVKQYTETLLYVVASKQAAYPTSTNGLQDSRTAAVMRRRAAHSARCLRSSEHLLGGGTVPSPKYHSLGLPHGAVARRSGALLCSSCHQGIAANAKRKPAYTTANSHGTLLLQHRLAQCKDYTMALQTGHRPHCSEEGPTVQTQVSIDYLPACWHGMAGLVYRPDRKAGRLVGRSFSTGPLLSLSSLEALHSVPKCLVCIYHTYRK